MASTGPARAFQADPYDYAEVRRLAAELELAEPVAVTLVRRGYRTVDAARRFLEARESHDPLEFTGMEDVCKQILAVVREGGHVTIHGDYDVDGVTSTSILVSTLRSLGAECDWFIPDRLSDGYGLTMSSVEELRRRCTELVITVDCGIGSVEEVAAARAAGIQVVVTDHHLPGEQLPDCPIIHPVVSDYPFEGLCAAGVAHKLAIALCDAAGQGAVETVGGRRHPCDQDLDLVALATVADMVPLVGENRRLVRRGLRVLRDGPRVGLRALMATARVDPESIDAGALSFRLAPRINAAGRLYRADAGVELMLTADAGRASQIAEELDRANGERRWAEQKVAEGAERARSALPPELADAPALVLAGEGWHPGVVGIAASRLVERHYRPTILLSVDGDRAKGSARSIPGFDLVAALGACDQHLVRYGGHRAAAGLELHPDHLDAFREAFIAQAASEIDPAELVRMEQLDALVGVGREGIGMDLARQLETLGPFGMGNPGPRLLVPSGRLREVRPLGAEGKHSRFQLESGAGRAQGVAFGMNGEISRREDQALDLSIELEVDRWNGAEQPRVVVRELYPLDSPAADEPRPRTCGEHCPAPDGEWWERLERERARVAEGSPGALLDVRAAETRRREAIDRRGGARRRGAHRPPRRSGDRVPRGADLERGAGPGDLRRRRPPRPPCLRGRRSAPLRRGPAADRLLPLRLARPRRGAFRSPRRRAGARRLDLGRASPAIPARLLPCGPDRPSAQRGSGEPGLGSPGGRRLARGALLHTPRLGSGRGRPRRADLRLGVGSARCDQRDLAPAGCERGRGRGFGAPLAARRRFGLPPDTRARRALRSGAQRARALRVAAESRRSGSAGLILGEDRFGALAGLQRLQRQTPGGNRIPPKQGTTDVASTPQENALPDGVELSDEQRHGHTRVGEPPERAEVASPDSITRELTAEQRALLGDLFAVIEEHKSDVAEPIDHTEIERAFAFACESHAGQERKSGEDFITHPLGVARICAGMRLDTATLCAALLHDTVEDTSASLDQVRTDFGDEIAQLVDGVTKLTGITFKSRDERQAENYRKMMVAMATDVRVILIKLADRLHNMRTIGALPKQKQQEKARETLEIFAPLAHRLGIHAIKWELEDLSFATLHPRKYDEIKELVAQQRVERERYVEGAGEFLAKELAKVGIDAEISGRAKHFYSIYTKMTRKGREFNEIFDLTAMRVLVGSVKDCYGAIGIVHSLWKPLPGRFKDFVAMPKANAYQALHTTVIGPEGRPLEIQIRTPEMHELAEYGIAAHVIYKDGGYKGGDE